MPTDNASLFLLTPFGEEVLYEVNRDAFNRTGSAALYQKHFGDKFDREDHLFIVIGTDSGLLPRWLAERGTARGCRFLFIELPAVIEAVRERLADILEEDRFVLCTADEWTQYQETLRLDEYLFIRKVELVDSLAAIDAHLAEYRVVSNQVDQELTAYNHRIQLQLGNQIFIKRQLENVADDLWPVQHLKDSFKGKSAVILGGGPSLDELLPWISANRDRLVVIAVSRISRQLLDGGFTPDIVVSVDPQEKSFEISKEMLRFPRETLFVNAYHVSPLLLGQWHGSAAYNGSKFPWKTPANGENMLAIGPTVTNNALALALHMGCSQVVLAGVDLCYSRDGFTHASGSNERLAGRALSAVCKQVETNGGWLADTNANLILAIQTMGDQAADAEKRGCRVINPAAGAAKIPNVAYVPSADIDLPELDSDIGSLIHQHLPDDDPATRRKLLQATAKELANANGTLRQILHLVDDALECNARIHDSADNGKYRKRLEKIERRLDKEFVDFTRVIKDSAARAFLHLSRPDRDREWTPEELLQWGKDYYDIYRTGTKQLLDQVEHAQQKVTSRLDELSEHPDLTALLQRWRDDGTPGRAKIWLERHTDADKAADQQQSLRRLADEFDEIVANQDTEHYRFYKGSVQQRLNYTRTKVQLLFEQANKDALAHIAGLMHTYGVPEADEIEALARGYIAELEGKTEDAFAHYNAIVDRAADKLDTSGEQEHNPRLEDALRRMSIIALQQGDADSAISVLDVLSALSPVYEPQYADILRLTGKLEDAVKIYTHYLERVPNDLATMLKLGKLFHDAGIDESARWAYDYILDKDPNNPAAQQLRDSLNA